MLIKSLLGLAAATIVALLAINRESLVSVLFKEKVDKEVNILFEKKLEDELIIDWRKVDEALVYSAWTNNINPLLEESDLFKQRWDSMVIKSKFNLTDDDYLINDIFRCTDTIDDLISNFEGYRKDIISDPRTRALQITEATP